MRIVGRRKFLKYVVATPAAGLLAPMIAWSRPRRIRAAAVQMEPRLADVEANLSQAEQLIKEAVKKGAEWIALPEMFTTAVAFHDDMLRAIRPIDGAPAQFLRDQSKLHNVTIGGSFLAQDKNKVFNSFLMFFPDGSSFRHDKDQPTYWETCYYEGGNDDGVLNTPAGDIGVALCWEMIRSRTARRLKGKIEMVMAGSTWWTLPNEADPDHPYRRVNKDMLQQAPPTLSRMLGVPVVHGAHAGSFSGFDSPELPDVAYDSAYLGTAMICDAQGVILAQRQAAQGAGVVLANVDMVKKPINVEPIPDRFWLPKQMPKEWKDAWTRWFPRGEDYYQIVTLPYLETGEMDEYVPPFMR